MVRLWVLQKDGLWFPKWKRMLVVPMDLVSAHQLGSRRVRGLDQRLDPQSDLLSDLPSDRSANTKSTFDSSEFIEFSEQMIYYFCLQYFNTLITTVSLQKRRKLNAPKSDRNFLKLTVYFPEYFIRFVIDHTLKESMKRREEN